MAARLQAQYLALTDERKAEFGGYIADRMTSYVDDAGMATPQENHFLTAVR